MSRPPVESSLFCPHVLLADGWARNARLHIAEDGRITRIEHGASPVGDERAAGPVIPGMPNLHSHAFQRAMAGLTERIGTSADSFWSWREMMYRFLQVLTPEDIEAIAAFVYLEMLKSGYTSVAEFHYLHHDRDGKPFGDRAETSRRIVSAAQTVGLRLTHLPVLYAHSGFGGKPPTEGQRRFINSVDALLDIVHSISAQTQGEPAIRVGLAFHSLRAVTPDELSAAVAEISAIDGTAPIHIHVAEQCAEVEECLAWSGRRPVAWLMDHAAVSSRWCLVHATHISPEETTTLARSGAVVGLCPTTEANLGDGLFPAEAYLMSGGAFGVGSDSHIIVSPAEELRLLEYGQRLHTRRRNVLRSGQGESTGVGLYQATVCGGSRALGLPAPGLTGGGFADLVVLNPAHPKLLGRAGEAVIDSYIFAGGEGAVCDVMVGGVSSSEADAICPSKPSLAVTRRPR